MVVYCELANRWKEYSCVMDVYAKDIACVVSTVIVIVFHLYLIK